MPTSIDPLSLKPDLDAHADKIRQRIEKAVAAATQKLADNILKEGRSDISGAGKFGARWTDGLTVDVSTDQPLTGSLTIRHAVPYWHIFQVGGVIHGKPLLWIPLSNAGLTGVSARDFPGRLFRVDRKSGGAPLLMSAADKQVKYTGHESVRIPKKFHLVEIITAQAKTFGALYRVEMTQG
jgi:hypothetical protein